MSFKVGDRVRTNDNWHNKSGVAADERGEGTVVGVDYGSRWPLNVLLDHHSTGMAILLYEDEVDKL